LREAGGRLTPMDLNRLPSYRQIKKSCVIDLLFQINGETLNSQAFYSFEAGQIELSFRANLSASLWASRRVAKE
jgi:hypothetical protein